MYPLDQYDVVKIFLKSKLIKMVSDVYFLRY